MLDTRDRGGGGITMLDIAALVTGAAVASVHVRALGDRLGSLSAIGWGLLALAFALLAATAAGPFVFLVRRFIHRSPAGGCESDWLWMLLGLPWLAAALYLSGASTHGEASYPPAYGEWLSCSLYAVCGVVFWRQWVQLRRDEGEQRSNPRRLTPWNQILGAGLTVAWPLQVGLGFLMVR